MDYNCLQETLIYGSHKDTKNTLGGHNDKCNKDPMKIPLLDAYLVRN
jgi:hypothetical protein